MCLSQGFWLIFQHTGHLFPSALFVSTKISSELFSWISTDEVMQSSDKSIPFIICNLFLSTLTISAASRLDPILLLILFSSMLKLQISRIFSNSDHFLFNSKFSNFLGIF